MKSGGSSGSYSITDLSREFSVTPRTLRFYEEKGLLNPKRSGKNRIYSARRSNSASTYFKRPPAGALTRGKRGGDWAVRARHS